MANLIDKATKFRQGTVEERHRILDAENGHSFDDIFSGLVHSAQIKIENTIFLLFLAAVEISSKELALVMENNDLRNQQQFETFNPISFGPGVG